jgi:hypothetical protein
MSNSNHIRITAAEFVEHLKGSGIIIKGGKKIFSHTHLSVVVSNVIVTGNVQIDFDFDRTITLQGESKIPNLSFGKNATIEALNIAGESTIINLIITNKAVLKRSVVYDKGIIHSIQVKENGKVKLFNFNTKSTELGRISLLNSGSIQTLNVLQNTKLYGIEVKGNSHIGSLSITSESYVNNIQINELSRVKHFSISGKSKVLPIHINGNAEVTKIECKGEANIKWFVVSEKAHVLDFYLEEEVNIGSIIMKDSCKVDCFNLNGGEITHKFDFVKLETDKLVFKGSETKLLSKTDSPLNINNIKLNVLGFIDFYSDKTIKLTSIAVLNRNAENYIEFTRSSFKKIEFIGNEFEDFNFFVFENSDFKNSFIANTMFPKEVQTRGRNDSKIFEDSLRQAKLFFEQMKTAYFNQGNRSEGLQYQAKELEMLSRLTKWEKGTKGDWLSLKFNWFSNKFGTDWLRASLFFVVVTAILYFVLLCFTENFYIDFGNLKETPKFIANYFEFINPTTFVLGRWHFIEGLENGELGIKVSAWLLFSKILIVVLIYQIIQAFRKHNRK